MARKDSIDDLDRELEELEEELRALEAGESQEELDLEEGLDEDLDEEDSPTLLSRLPFGKSSKGKQEAEETDPPEADEEAPEPESKISSFVDRLKGEDDASEEAPEEDSGATSLIGRFRRDTSDEDVAEEASEEDLQPEAQTPEAPLDEGEDTPEAPEDSDEDADEAPAEDDGPGRFKGFVDRIKTRGSEDEEDTEDGLDEAEPVEEPEEPAPEAKGLFARLKGSSSDEGEEAAPDEDAVPETPPKPQATRRSRTAWERAEDGSWKRRESDDPLPEDLEADQPPATAEDPEPPEEPEDEEQARELLGRFKRSSGDGGDDPPSAQPEDDDEEERKKPVLLIAGVAVLALLVAAAGLYLLAGDGGVGGGAVAPAATVTVTDGSPGPDGGFVGMVGSSLTFDASGTSGDVDEYRWDFGDGQQETTTSPTARHTYQSRGTFDVRVTAVGAGEESVATLAVLVVQAPEAQAQVLRGGQPVAAPGTDGNNALVGEPVTFSADGSSGDPEAPLASYQWHVDGDGTADATGESPSFTFDQAGMWTVVLTVTDELGNTAQAQQMVHVSNRFAFNDTSAQAAAEPAVNEHPISVDEGRMATPPAQVVAELTYTAPQASIGGDLDLVLVDADGNEYPADAEDDGSGSETITLTDLSSAALGDWTVRVTQESPSLSEVPYEVVVRVIY